MSLSSVTKPILASKTVWGVATALVATLLAPAALTASGVDPTVADAISRGVAAAGTLIALAGRIWATQRLSGVVSTPPTGN